MRLAPGESFDRYTIEDFLGEGGMGQVYRAHDSKLHRRVALKLLRVDSVKDDRARSTGQARLLREARAVAGLDHPNAIAVFDVGDVDGTPYIAMEFVDGTPLRRLIADAATGLEQKLRWLADIAGALGAAHKQGIVHRDVKPENIMVRADGVIKVLDFGIARRAQPDASPLAPTETAEAVLGTLTATGAVVGTPLYMSPEQMRGEELDGRSDQFAWGVVAHELLSGSAPWKGTDSLAIVSQILSVDPPDLAQAAPTLPAHVCTTVMRALAKRPEQRFASMEQLIGALEGKPVATADNAPAVSATAPAADDTGNPAAPPRSRLRWIVGALALALPLVGWLGYRLASRRTAAQPTATAPAAPAPLATPVFKRVANITSESGPEIQPAVSPDGTWVVYARRTAGKWDLFRRRVGGKNAQNLTADAPDADDWMPAISPDGEKIAFRSERDGGGIFVMGATGESVKRVTDLGYDPSWSPDGGSLVVGNWRSNGTHPGTQSLWKVDVVSGVRTRLHPLDAKTLLSAFGRPRWSPHGQRIAWWGGMGQLWSAAADGSNPAALTSGGFDLEPVWSPDGRHLWFTSMRGDSSAVWRVAVDEARGQATAPPQMMFPTLNQFVELGGFSRDGKQLVMSSAHGRLLIEKVAFDPVRESASGAALSLGSGLDPEVRGELVAFMSEGQLTVMKLDGSGRRELTDATTPAANPAWSSDGTRVLFSQVNKQGGIQPWEVGVDGSGLRLLVDAPFAYYPVAAPDGKRIAVGTPEGTKIISTEPGGRTLDELPPPDGPGTILAPKSWSRDGARLAGEIDHYDGAGKGIAIWSFATKQYVIVSATGIGAAWLKDSQRLLHASTSSTRAPVSRTWSTPWKSEVWARTCRCPTTSAGSSTATTARSPTSGWPRSSSPPPV